MRKLYKCEEWQSCSGNWYVNDTHDLAHNSGYWYHAVAILQISVDEYVKLLTEKFNAKRLHYTVSADVLIFSFDSQKDARAYKNFINKKARERNYLCGE